VRTYLQGKYVVKSTGERTVAAATKVATDWYLDLRDRTRKGEHHHGQSFADLASKFLLTHADQMRELSEGQRRNYRQKWELLKGHFSDTKVQDIDTRFLSVRSIFPVDIAVRFAQCLAGLHRCVIVGLTNFGGAPRWRTRCV
jgi:hypothetical protein